MGGNVAVMVLSLISWIMRVDNPAGFILPWGLGISLVVATLLGITGWYGGELSFRHKVGVIGTSSHYDS